jgi:hypothetical protein
MVERENRMDATWRCANQITAAPLSLEEGRQLR